MFHTAWPATTHSASRSIAPESRMLRSMMRASSTASAGGRPASHSGAPMGLNSTPKDSCPSVGRSGYGGTRVPLTCASARVVPISSSQVAAVGEREKVQLICRGSSASLPSTRQPAASAPRMKLFVTSGRSSVLRSAILEDAAAFAGRRRGRRGPAGRRRAERAFSAPPPWACIAT